MRDKNTAFGVLLGISAVWHFSSILWLSMLILLAVYVTVLIHLKPCTRQMVKHWNQPLKGLDIYYGCTADVPPLDINLGAAARRIEMASRFWPFNAMAPDDDIEPIDGVDLLLASLIVSYWSYDILRMLDYVEYPAVFIVVHAGLVSVALVLAGLRLWTYVGVYRSPISLLGRISARTPIIPRFDMVFVGPGLTVLAAIVLPLVFRVCHIPTVISFPLALGVVIVIAFGTGPAFHVWRLTGGHRIVPAQPPKGSERGSGVHV